MIPQRNLYWYVICCLCLSCFRINGTPTQTFISLWKRSCTQNRNVNRDRAARSQKRRYSVLRLFQTLDRWTPCWCRWLPISRESNLSISDYSPPTIVPNIRNKLGMLSIKRLRLDYCTLEPATPWTYCGIKTFTGRIDTHVHIFVFMYPWRAFPMRVWSCSVVQTNSHTLDHCVQHVFHNRLRSSVQEYTEHLLYWTTLTPRASNGQDSCFLIHQLVQNTLLVVQWL